MEKPNELAWVAEKEGIDVMEAIKSANKGYPRNQIPIPGPVSGYCLGKDPYMLELSFKEIAEERGFNSVWYYGRLANDWMVERVLKGIYGKRVLVAGLAFKKDIDDFRYSFGIALARKLIEKGYKVLVHDPYLGFNYYTSLPKDLQNKVNCVKELTADIFNSVDTIIFATNHAAYYNIDLKSIDKKINKKIRIIDLWNIFYSQKGYLANIDYRGLGVTKI